MKRNFEICKKCSCFKTYKPSYVNNSLDRGKEVYVCGLLQYDPNEVFNYAVLPEGSPIKGVPYETSWAEDWNWRKIPNKCELYAELCMSEWNENEKKD